jgi:hypothetical protein
MAALELRLIAAGWETVTRATHVTPLPLTPYKRTKGRGEVSARGVGRLNSFLIIEVHIEKAP